MHIVFFVDYHINSLGGVQTSVRALRNALEKAGHQVTLVTPPAKYPSPPDHNTIFAPSLPFSPYEHLLAIPSKRRELWIEQELAKRPPVDIIHVHSNTGVGIMGVNIAKRLRLPLFQSMHTRDDIFFQKTARFPLLATLPAYLLHKAFLKAPNSTVHRLDESLSAFYSWRVMVHHAQQADVVITPSRHFAQRLKQHGLSRPVEVISNGIDDDMLKDVWRDEPKGYEFRAPLKLVWVNRLSAEKRPMLCIETVKDIPGVLLDFYGKGPEEPAIRRYIRKHHLEDKVRLNGSVSQEEVLLAIAKSDVFALTSYQFDTQSMVLLESIGVGVPVILSDPDLIESLPSGSYILTNAPDGIGLRDALIEVLDNPEKLAEMRQIMHASRESVLQGTIAKKMTLLYQHAIDI